MHRFEYTPTAWKHLAGVMSTTFADAVQLHMYVRFYQRLEDWQKVRHRDAQGALLSGSPDLAHWPSKALRPAALFEKV